MMRLLTTLMTLAVIAVFPLPAGPGQTFGRTANSSDSRFVETPWYKTIKKTEMRWVSLGTFDVSAYCAGCRVCDTTWKTADGTYADYRKRIVAADPRVAFGTALKIDGFDDSFVVRDRGSAIKGRKLDVLMSSHWRAKRFGRQDLEVWTLQPVEVEIQVEVPKYAIKNKE